MKVECVYASENQNYLISLQVPENVTIEFVIQASGVLDLFPELSLKTLNVGIFSQKKILSDFVCEGDRVEIYRPLCLNPMEARRRRAPPPKRRKF